MKVLVYIALVVVLAAPLIRLWNPVRKWLGPEQSLATLLLRILIVAVVFILYSLLAFWLALYLMGLFKP